MEFLDKLTDNTILMAAVIGWLVAQILKTGIHLFLTRKFVAERLVGSGGMPSSHSATVCALASAAAFKYGVQSFPFAISAILAIIVMYDAIGVRRETGRQSKVLNEMIELFTRMDTGMSPQDRLREFIGHTPLQVLIGAVIGILTACLMYL